jgi:hypothetical protein
MPVAQKYQLMVANFGTVYIGKQSKSNPNLMLSDRVEVTKSYFIQYIMQWTEAQLEDGCKELEITDSTGKIVMEIKLNK